LPSLSLSLKRSAGLFFQASRLISYSPARLPDLRSLAFSGHWPNSADAPERRRIEEEK
jgi:hypothetical protein